MTAHRRFRLAGWAAWAVIVALVLLGLGGCASAPVSGLCAVKPLGQNEQGIYFVRYSCQEGK